MQKLQFNSTSSNNYWIDVNKNTINELQKYFEREVKSNIYFMPFQTQELRFDIGTDFINVLILDHEDNDKWTDKKSKKLATAIAKRIDNKGNNFLIFVGDYSFKFNDLI